jgi:triacylglycerol esterase/lipase EstA (alpha/beta hydrolase family)
MTQPAFRESVLELTQGLSWIMPRQSSVALGLRSLTVLAVLFPLVLATGLGWCWALLLWAAWGLTPPLVLGLQFLVARKVNQRVHRQRRPLSLSACVTAWWAEWRAATRVFAWHQPWCWRQVPDAQTPAPGVRGVVLVHGYLCNRGVWTPWLQALQQRGVPVVAVHLEPVWADIDHHAAVVDRAVTHLCELTGLPPVVVAHSMGGLVVRAWMREALAAEDRVHHVVTIASPHQGTWLARWGHGVLARQMGRYSPWLQQLAAQESPQRRQKFTCWHSDGDNIVFPLGTAVLSGAAERHVAAQGHLALIDHPAVLADVMDHLRT